MPPCHSVECQKRDWPAHKAECSKRVSDVATWRMRDCLSLLKAMTTRAPSPDTLRRLVPGLRRLRYLLEESYAKDGGDEGDIGLQLHQLSYLIRLETLLEAPAFERWLLNQVRC